ncbi:GEVED domain-containing protein [Vibrio scophthalmi]|uniref:Uncharacterized protein n=1 Tax=Vibrio scophthalmi TaxID=45658 RepID=A0A1C7FCN9_9VIBR|nr:DUF6701 domain-containing protein [Vibrio scophthalmi]ANU36799.1 hypothetical protein VSVS05_01674 [Vibrio scophthalmi]
MSKKLFLLMLTLFFSAFASAQNGHNQGNGNRHPHGYSVSGFVFEHYNFGGYSRDFFPGASGMVAMDRTPIDVRLSSNNNQNRVYTARTDWRGQFWFNRIPNGTYILTLPYVRPMGADKDGQIYSERGDCNECLPVQVWPYVSDHYQRTVVVNGGNVYDANIGFSYSVVNNNNDSGVGSLRQFLLNTRYLTTGRHPTRLEKENLRQEWHPSGVDNAIFTRQLADIVLQSPLEIYDTEDTYVDARVRLGSGRPLTLNNRRNKPQQGDYGIKITNSEELRIAGMNWNYFDDAVYLDHSEEVEVTDNSFNHTRDSGVKLVRSDENIISRNMFNDTVNKEANQEEAAAVFLEYSSENQVTGNAFYDTGDDHQSDSLFRWHVSAVRVYYGNKNLISQNTFSNTRGLAIDLRSVEHAGQITRNNGLYDWSAGASNNGIDYPMLQAVNLDGTASGTVTLRNIGDGSAVCRQTISDVSVELYKADGQVSDSTIEGTAFIGSCRLNSQGAIAGCNLDHSRFAAGDPITSIAIDKCGNTSEMGQVITSEDDGRYDYGDAPNQDLHTGWGKARFPVLKADNGARHRVKANTCLLPVGASECAFHVDEEKEGQPSRYASADQEDDGVKINPNNSELSNAAMPVLMTGYLDRDGREQRVDNQISVNASKAGYISVWLDKNQDGSWQGFERNTRPVSEMLLDRYPVNAGENVINGLYLSPYDVHGESWLRIRYSTDQNAVAQPTGVALDGEVEDYRVWIAAPSLEVAGCEAGLQNGSFEHFFIEKEHNGWDTPESSVAGWSIEQLDPTLNPQDYFPVEPRRSNIEFNRYDYYVKQPSSDGSLNVAEMNVYNPTMMYQDIVTKPGDKIRWSFDYSNRTVPNDGKNDQISLLFGSPNSQLVEDRVIDGQDRWVKYTGVYTVPAGQYVTRIAFRSNYPTVASSGNILDNAKFGCEIGYDYGDLPGRYGQLNQTRYEVVPNLYIGEEAPDTELAAQISESASGDDQTGFNDERTFASPVILKKQHQVEIADLKVINSTGKAAKLDAWIDFNRDGVMEDKERATPHTIQSKHGAQNVTLTWNGINPNKWTTQDSSFLRLVLSQDSSSRRRNGEVEDHLVYFINDDLLPQPGRCDGFIQVKDPQGRGRYQYAKWVASGGQLAIESINPALATDEIKVVGQNPIDGLTYGVGSDRRYGCTSGSRSGCEVHLFVADQSRNPAAEFHHLVPLRAAHDGVTILDKEGHRYTFRADEIFNTQKSANNGTKKLSRANSGDVSLDGRYLVIGRGVWRSLVRIDLKTGVFDTIQLDIPQGEGTPWSADFAFNPQFGDSRYVYGLSGDLKSLYRIAIVDISAREKAGSYSRLPLTLVLNSSLSVNNPQWPIKDRSGKLASGGVGINKGGIVFAMTNGGLHDLNQNGRLDSAERETPTTALYSIDIAKQEIRFELQGVEESTTSNDAGGCAIHADYGDVPEVLEGGNPARHLGSSELLKLGHHWSADIGPGHDGYADSDFSDDGVIIRDKTSGSEISLPNGALLPLRSYAISLDKRGGGQATAWVNWGNDTQWHSVNLNKGIDVPLNAGARGYLRVRYADRAVSSPYGEAPSGEVEDISFAIGNPIKGIKVTAPGSPLTCEVAEYRILLDVEGGVLSQDLNVDVSFENPPSGCWFDASPFGRADAASHPRCSGNSKTILFNKNGSLNRSIWVATDSELGPVTLKASAKDVGFDKDSAQFSKTGFKIVPYQAPQYYKAGQEFSLQLARKVALEDQTSCAIDTDYQGDKTFTWRYNQGLEPVLGEMSMQGKTLNAKGEKRTVSFSNGVSEVLPASYTESGSLNIEADYQLAEGLPKSADISLSVNPYALVVKRNYSANESKLENRGIQQPFVSAGTPFMVEVAAVAKDGTITRNFNASLASGKTGFDSGVVVPLSQTSNAPLLSAPNGLNRVFTNGLLTNRFEYDNVGSISTHWAVDRYAGQTGLTSFLDTQQTSDALDNYDQVGYFYPDYMLLSSQFSVPMTHDGEPWTYFGKPDVALAFSLSAKSANHRDLSFYDASVLSAAEKPLLASMKFDYGNLAMPSCNQQLLVDEDNQPLDFAQSWSQGQWQLKDYTAMFYRDVGCKQPLSDVALQASVSSNVAGRTIPIYQNSDMDTDLSGETIPLGESVDVRFGRLVVNNASGPIDQLLPMAIRAEYWQGSRFINNEWDQWSQIGQSGIANLPTMEHIKTSPAKDGQAAPVIMAGSMETNSISNGQVTTHIGGNAPGYARVPLTFSGGAEKWLGYCWLIDDASTSASSECRRQVDYWQAPEALATFGVSAGSNNVIYFMEKYQ